MASKTVNESVFRKSGRSNVLRLIPRVAPVLSVDEDTVEVCQMLLAGALNGEIVGLVFGMFHPGGHPDGMFTVDLAGQAITGGMARARGVVAFLDDECRLLEVEAASRPDGPPTGT
jgi:hypothetical protein